MIASPPRPICLEGDRDDDIGTPFRADPRLFPTPPSFCFSPNSSFVVLTSRLRPTLCLLHYCPAFTRSVPGTKPQVGFAPPPPSFRPQPPCPPGERIPQLFLGAHLPPTQVFISSPWSTPTPPEDFSPLLFAPLNGDLGFGG